MIPRILGAMALTALSLTAAAQTAPSAEKQRMIDLGIEHGTARALYDHFKQEANGGTPLTWAKVPDWTGIWRREAQPFFWDPDQTSRTARPTAKLTPEHERLLRDKLDKVE